MPTSNNNQLTFGLPDAVHPGVLRRREAREQVPADDASQRAAMRQRHRQEWDDHLDLWHDALLKRNPMLAELAKTLAQTLKIRQTEERLTWSDAQTAPSLDPETRRRRIAQLAKEVGLVVLGD